MRPHHPSRSWLPWLLLLPLAILAWPGPGAPLVDDPFPHIGGSGWMAFGSLPAALWLVFAGRARPLSGLRLLVLLWLLVSVGTWLGSPSDPFEGRRAWVHMGSCLVFFAAGAQLDSHGRRRLNRGMVLLSLLWSAWALWLGVESGYAGVLGNSGTLSQAALPGAVIGAWYVVSRRGLYWFLGLLAFALFLAHAGLAPVLAGGLSMLLALLASCFISPWATRKEQVRRRLGILAALSAFALVGVAQLGSSGALENAPPAIGDSESKTPAKDSSELGGVSVRWMIWGSIPALLAEQPLFGLGPGQFQAAYPPYRDAREIEASRGGDLSAADTFVNHAHNDLLQGLAEWGLLAGLLWLGFLGLALRAGLRALGQTDFPTIASAAAALAMLCNALFHSPLSMNPVAAGMACMLFGVVCGRHPAQTGLQPTRGWRIALLAVSLACLPSAWSMIRFGSAFSEHIRANKFFIELDEAGGGPGLNQLYLDVVAARKAAIEVAPQSAPSRLTAARTAEGEEQLERWQQVLEVRPHSVEALDRIGMLHASSDRTEEARASWKRALDLSPTQPRILENIARLELKAGDPEQGNGFLERRLALGALQPGLGEYFGSLLVLNGLWSAGTALLTGTELEASNPNQINADYQALRKSGPEQQADALRCLSQLLWAREHTLTEDYDVALRSYGQALRPTRKLRAEGASVLRVEIAALHLLSGNTAKAQAEVQGITLSELQWSGLPSWACEAIASAGLLEGR